MRVGVDVQLRPERQDEADHHSDTAFVIFGGYAVDVQTGGYYRRAGEDVGAEVDVSDRSHKAVGRGRPERTAVGLAVDRGYVIEVNAEEMQHARDAEQSAAPRKAQRIPLLHGQSARDNEIADDVHALEEEAVVSRRDAEECRLAVLSFDAGKQHQHPVRYQRGVSQHGRSFQPRFRQRLGRCFSRH